MERRSIMAVAGAALGTMAGLSAGLTDGGHYSARHVGQGQMRARSRDAQRRMQAAARSGPETIANLPGETNRQLAARIRAEASHDDAPARPKRVRKAAV